MRRNMLIISLALNALLIAGIAAGAYALIGVADRYVAQAAERWRTQYDLLPDRERGIVFLGDSITEGGRWDEWFPDSDIINRGIGGNKTNDVLARLDQIYRLQPRQIFLMIGINDLNLRRSLPDILDNYRAIFDGIEQHLPRTRVMVQSVLPLNDDLRYAVDGDSIVRVNRFLQAEADRRGYAYIDLHAAFSDDRGQLRRELSNDGIHLLGAGYALWRDQITALIEP